MSLSEKLSRARLEQKKALEEANKKAQQEAEDYKKESFNKLNALLENTRSMRDPLAELAEKYITPLIEEVKKELHQGRYAQISSEYYYWTGKYDIPEENLGIYNDASIEKVELRKTLLWGYVPGGKYLGEESVSMGFGDYTYQGVYSRDQGYEIRLGITSNREIIVCFQRDKHTETKIDLDDPDCKSKIEDLIADKILRGEYTSFHFY